MTKRQRIKINHGQALAEFIPLVFPRIKLEPRLEVLTEVLGEGHVDVSPAALRVGSSRQHSQLALVERARRHLNNIKQSLIALQ